MLILTSITSKTLQRTSPNFISFIKLKMSTSTNCIFCKIVAKTQPADIIFEDEDLIIFKDIKPAAKVHVLVVPKLHIKDPSSLKYEDKDLMQKMIDAGKNLLQQKGCNVDDTITGFHWPPFNSIKHLHLHVINPASEMGLLSRAIFKPNTWWFVTDKYVMNKISEPQVTSHL